MRGEFLDDTFTETDVFSALETAGLKYKTGHRYILSQCPLHEDQNPSVQIYRDDWFVNCHAGCGRFHITKAFPHLRENGNQGFVRTNQPRQQNKNPQGKIMEHKYKTYDLMHEWEQLPQIPRDHKFKTIPLEVLDELGWRWDEYKKSYFIPYFDRNRNHIPFGQWRHLQGERRFTFLPEAKPIAYGLWNLDNSTLFVVEGASDCAVLEYAAVPWLGMPSAASGTLMQGLAHYCKKNAIQLVYAGDNDAAGDKLREALDEIMPYRVCQPPKKYKDWGDFLLATDIETVQNYCFKELFPQEYPSTPEEAENKTALERVQDVFPGAVELQIVGSQESSKELTVGEPTALF